LDLVGRAANLEGAGALQVFAFEEDFAPGNLVERVRSDDGRAVNAAGDPRRGFFDKFGCQHWKPELGHKKAQKARSR
jgi:hypothetical protein